VLGGGAWIWVGGCDLRYSAADLIRPHKGYCVLFDVTNSPTSTLPLLTKPTCAQTLLSTYKHVKPEPRGARGSLGGGGALAGGDGR